MRYRKKLPWLSFDCYDTLVRYSESKALRIEQLVRSKGGNEEAVTRAQETFQIREKTIQEGPFRLLNEVLKESLKDALSATNLPCSTEDEMAIVDAVCTAAPFTDVPTALHELRSHFRIAVLSNSEPEIIRHNIIRIGVGMDAIVLASDAKCYKPDLRMFDALLSRTGVSAAEVTHVAQSLYHDIRPAKDKGIGKRIWINRYGRAADGAYTPDHELSDLTQLPNILI